MANTCSYTARIRGKKQNVVDFMWWLVGFGPFIYIGKEMVCVPDLKNTIKIKHIIRDLEKGKWKNGYVGRIGHWSAKVDSKIIGDEMLVEIEDYCAWSFLSSGIENALNDDNFGDRKSVPELCRIYDIQFELFSEETGSGFDEYYFFNGRNEEEDRDEEFDHDDVTSAMKEEWTIDDEKDICWKWVKKNGKRHKEKRDKDEVFFETKNRLFPHEFRELYEDEWMFDAPQVSLQQFCQNNKNSWNVSWEQCVEWNKIQDI